MRTAGRGLGGSIDGDGGGSGGSDGGDGAVAVRRVRVVVYDDLDRVVLTETKRYQLTD